MFVHTISSFYACSGSDPGDDTPASEYYSCARKFGFKNINRVEYKVINLKDLQKLADKYKLSNIDDKVLIENGLANKKDLIKILGRGELKAKLEVKAHAFSKTAKTAIETNKGTAIKL